MILELCIQGPKSEGIKKKGDSIRQNEDDNLYLL